MRTTRTSCNCPGRIVTDQSRRSFLKCSSAGFGWLAFSGLFSGQANATGVDASVPQFVPRAKNVIFCFMDGGPSHVDTFDPKPMLTKHQGERMGDRANARKSQASPNRVWLGCPWEFTQRGESGLWVSDLFPSHC